MGGKTGLPPALLQSAPEQMHNLAIQTTVIRFRPRDERRVKIRGKSQNQRHDFFNHAFSIHHLDTTPLLCYYDDTKLVACGVNHMGKKGAQALDKNPFWKGGRTVASNGYVLVKAPENPMADCRGYVYEHRLIAEQKIGRPLLPGEEVHHIDHNRQNNAPGNLEVVKNDAEHGVRHRKRSDLQVPGGANPLIACACGCGNVLLKYDTSRRPRRYISGHNTGERNHQWATARR